MGSIFEAVFPGRTDEVAVVALGALDDDDALFVAALAELVAAAVVARHVGVFGRLGRGAREDDAEPAVDDLADRGALVRVDGDARRFAGGW